MKFSWKCYFLGLLIGAVSVSGFSLFQKRNFFSGANSKENTDQNISPITEGRQKQKRGEEIKEGSEKNNNESKKKSANTNAKNNSWLNEKSETKTSKHDKMGNIPENKNE